MVEQRLLLGGAQQAVPLLVPCSHEFWLMPLCLLGPFPGSTATP